MGLLWSLCWLVAGLLFLFLPFSSNVSLPSDRIMGLICGGGMVICSLMLIFYDLGIIQNCQKTETEK